MSNWLNYLSLWGLQGLTSQHLFLGVVGGGVILRTSEVYFDTKCHIGYFMNRVFLSQ